MFKLVLEKAEEPETKLPTFAGSLKKQEPMAPSVAGRFFTTEPAGKLEMTPKSNI